jgi:GT2 family glycosyltransferase
MGKKEYKVSFCTVTYNSRAEILRLIENIESLKISASSSELFVVDNGSSDDTVKVVRELANEYNNIRLIVPGDNKGFGAGNNAVLPLLDSDYHILVNPDVHIESGEQINSMISYMNEHLEVGLLSPKILNVNGSVQKLYKRNPTVMDMALRFISPKLMKKRQAWFVHDETGYNASGRIEHASGAFMFFRTSVFKAIDGFDERYFMYMEDADITREVNAISIAIFFPGATVVHKWKRQSHSNLKFMWYTVRSMIQYFSKWGWKLW